MRADSRCDSVTGNSVDQSLETVAPGASGRVHTTVLSGGGPVTFYCHFDFKGSKKKLRANIVIGDNTRDYATAAAQ